MSWPQGSWCGQQFPHLAETAALLADEVLPEQPLRQWVLSLPMALRFLLATRPAVLSEVLGVVHRTISGHLLARAGVRRVAGHTGAVTLIQRFGSALNLNVHFHMLFVDGVYVTEGSGAPVFRAVRSPGAGELQVLVQRLAEGIGRRLEKRGLIERDAESAWLSGELLSIRPMRPAASSAGCDSVLRALSRVPWPCHNSPARATTSRHSCRSNGKAADRCLR